MSCDTSAPLKQVTLFDTVAGDLWDGIPQGNITFNQIAPPVALARIDMHFQRNWSDLVPTFKLSTVAGTGIGTISILNAAAWQFAIPPQALPLQPGVWLWGLRFTDANGTVLTPVGGTLNVLKGIPKS